MTRQASWVVVPAFVLAACAGKPESATPAADTTAVVPPAAAPAAVDSAAPTSADSTIKPTATTKASAPKVEAGDYDQAIKPRFRINEKTGKIDTIKRP